MEDKNRLFANEVYEHFKGGMYTVLLVGTDEKTKVNKVVYQSHDTNIIWIRDYEEFVGYVDVDGELVKRFTYKGNMHLEQFTYKHPKLIKTWGELAELESETHTIDIHPKYGSGWIKLKDQNQQRDDKNFFKHNHYLSTHSFYGPNYQHSTELLQKCGFNVQLANWDE